MTPERWQQVKAIFDMASQLAPDARRELLDRTCGGDMALRREVESLLAAHDKDPGLSFRPGAAGADGVIRDPLELDVRMRQALSRALAHRYEILRLGWRGGMGAVYVARDIALDLRVAIKVLRPELVPSQESRQRFLKEARIAARLRHPNIVRLHHYVEVEDVWCFVMDYVPGGALDDQLGLDGAMSCEETRAILIELAGALDYAHAHGVVHRDIKPGNILFDAERKPMLADFGIAKVSGDDTLTPPHETRGTPAYMSPEQLKGGHGVDGRSDIYSLGLVAYAMLLGKQPYAGLSVGQIFTLKLSEDPVPIAQVAPLVTPELAKVIMQCLARDPAQRYPDARALKEALEHADCSPTERLHPAVVEMPGFGQWALVWAMFWTTYAVLGNHGRREQLLTLVVAGLVPLGFALQVWNLGRHPLGRSELVRVSYWPPVWWGMWWPHVLRRPTDLWMRLPWPARAVRIVLSIFFVGMPALVMAQSMRVTPSAGIAAAEYALFVATGLATAAGILWSRRRGVPSRETTRVLFGATLQSSVWRTPTLARLLAPARGVRPPQHDDAADYARAISEIAALLPEDFMAGGRESASLSRGLLGVMRNFDREITLLDRDASPAEIDKLTAQLTLLGPPSATEASNRRALRDAINNQLAVLHSMRRDVELAEDARDEVFDLIRSVWAHVRRLHEEATTDEAQASGAGDALRVLCVEIQRRLELWAEKSGGNDEHDDGEHGSPAARPARVPPTLGAA